MMKKFFSTLFLVSCLIVFGSECASARVSSEVINVHSDTAWFQRKDGFDVFGAVVEYSSGGDSETFTVNYKVMSNAEGEVYQKIIDSSYIFRQYNGEWRYIGKKHGVIEPTFSSLYVKVANTCAQKMGYQRY